MAHFLIKHIILTIAILTWLITLLFKHSPYLTEVVYSEFLYPTIAKGLSVVSNVIPISISDLLYVTFVVFIISIPILLVVLRKRMRVVLLLSLKVLAFFYVFFYWLWGFNYFRESVYTRMDFKEVVVSDSVFDHTFNLIINNLSDSYSTDAIIDQYTINFEIEKSYKQLAPILHLNYPNGKRRPKHMLFSAHNASSGISGYFGPFFNEIHMNKHLLPVQYPVILAHEKAHQFGITSEAEASFYAWLVCKNSNNPKLKYSAELFILRLFLLNVNRDERQKYEELLPEYVVNDMTLLKKFWKSWRIPWIDKVQSKVYDWYLKGNNIPDGLSNYGGVVKLICEYEQFNANLLD